MRPSRQRCGTSRRTLTEIDRAARMAERIADTARSLGVDAAGVQLAVSAFTLAMRPRRRALDDEHHPAYLHPGRSVVILMDDVGETDPTALAAGALLESEDAPLRVPAEEARLLTGDEVADFLAAVPASGAEDLAEALVSAGATVRRVALAERLDHLRHAHLWPDMERRYHAHREAQEVYARVAERTDETLARRYRWWCSMFGEHHLG